MPKAPLDHSHSAGNGKDSAAAKLAASARAGMSQEFHDFLADVEDLIKATKSLTGEELDRAKAQLSDRVSAARQSVDEMGSEIADQARSTAKITDRYVHEQPWQSIGIGAAVGLLVGFVIARRA